MTVEIPLTKGLVALVDVKDYAIVKNRKWHAIRVNNTWYARSYIRASERTKGCYIRMHQLILGTVILGVIRDHRDGNGLNNTRRNLRRATHQQSLRNRGVSKNNKAGYRGVVSRGGKWIAVIHVNRKQIYIGGFETKEDAALAYDREAVNLFGDFARLNYPLKFSAEQSIDKA